MALYKAQFEPVEFFNGFRWSRNLAELKHLVRTAPEGKHRLETPEFVNFVKGRFPNSLAAKYLTQKKVRFLITGPPSVKPYSFRRDAGRAD